MINMDVLDKIRTATKMISSGKWIMYMAHADNQIIAIEDTSGGGIGLHVASNLNTEDANFIILVKNNIVKMVDDIDYATAVLLTIVDICDDSGEHQGRAIDEIKSLALGMLDR